MRAWMLVLMVLAGLAPGLMAARAADQIGNCELTGSKGEMTIASLAVPGQLTVAVSLPASMYWNGATPEAIKDGFEYCLAANIAWRAGLGKLVILDVPWPKLTSGEATGFDLALSEITITPSRGKHLKFSVPYFTKDFGVLVKPGTAIDEKLIEQLRVGVEDGTPRAQFVKGSLKIKQVETYGEFGEMLTALHGGQIDAAVADLGSALAEQGLEGGSLVTGGRYHSGEAFGAVYPTSSVNGPAFDKIIAALLADGTQKALAKKYLWSLWGLDPDSVGYFSP